MRIEPARIAVALTLLLAALAFAPVNAQAQARVTNSFDQDWRFSRSDAQGAERPRFDDAAWRKLDVPHDWSIEGPFDEKNPTGRDGAYLPAGVGWYRKHFNVPAGHSTRRVFVEFDGVMANSDVWINGKHLGRRPYGYIGFRYELTDYLNFGGANLLAVRADNAGQPASRWYAGAGIYRHVRLVTTDPVHIEHWGSFVTTPLVTDARATVNVRSTVVNQSPAAQKVALQVQLVDTGGKVVATAETGSRQLAAGESADFTQQLSVDNPVRWDITNPALYRAVARLRSGGRVIDDETVTFGIREFRFEPATGFWLNGRNFKLKGVCLHQDGGAFGAAVPLRVWERRLEVLRQFGVNAIRTAHNPPAPEFLDLADRMGFIVMDETFDVWTVAKRPFDYHLYFNEWSKIDTRDTVRRDRNHPSVVIYSTGNEIHDTPQPELARRVLSGLIEVFHHEDPTRPVTQALFRPNVSKDYDNGLADMLDVVGQNYREQEILAAYRQNPARRILGTENTHVIEQWLALRDNPPYAGQFIWAGIDYLGESPGWPLISSDFGLLDRTATPRPLAFQRLSWWGTSPMVYAARRVAPTPLAPTDPGYGNDRRPQVLYGDWTPRTLDAHDEDVEVYSNAEQVELLLNGRSLGSRSRPPDDMPRNWKVPFEPGTLRAVGSNGGRVVATHELKTAGKAARVLLSVDRLQLAQAWDDVAQVEATVVDANGVIVPSATDLITFKASGAGRVVAVDSGDNASHEPFQATARHAYQGRSFAMLKADAARGHISVTATAAGLAAGNVTIAAVPQSALHIGRNQTESATDYFGKWPAGTSPREVGKRVAENWIARSFEFEQTVTTDGVQKPRRQFVIYPEVNAWYGSLAVARLMKDRDLSARLVRKFDRFLTPAGDAHVSRESHVDYSVFGAVPLELYLQTKDRRYLDLGRGFADRQWEKATPDGITTQARYWVDDMYMINIVQAQAFRATGDMKYLDRASLATASYLDRLQQPNGLFHHATDSPFFWGRGNGWYAAGMAELLRSLPQNHPRRTRIMQGYKAMMAALLKYQAGDGMWRQLVDRPDVWAETSGTGMFAFALVTGVKEGWLDAQTYGPAARKAWLGLVDQLDAEANVRAVCIGTNKAFQEVGPDLDTQLRFYLDRPRKTGDLHGQFPILWTAMALLR